MEKLANTYFDRIKDYYESRNYLIFLILFSVANIVIYYLLQVPFIAKLLEFFDLNSYLAPAASLPRFLIVWYASQNKWLLGLLFMTLSLLPYLWSLLLTDKQKNKKATLKGWDFLPAVIWYTVDIVFHSYFAVTSLISAFSYINLFWEVIGFLFRIGMIALLINGIVAAVQMNRAKEKMIDMMAELVLSQKGPEVAKQYQREHYWEMVGQYLLLLQKKNTHA